MPIEGKGFIMNKTNPKLNVKFTLKQSIVDTNDVSLHMSWACPECGDRVERFIRAVTWHNPIDGTSFLEACLFKEWECDECLSPEAKHRRILMRQFDIRSLWR